MQEPEVKPQETPVEPAAAPVEMLDFEAAMARLGLSRAEVYRRVKEGKLKGQKQEQHLHFATTEVERLRGELTTEANNLSQALDEALNLFADRLAQHGARPDEDLSAKTSDERVAALGTRILTDAALGGIQDLYLDPLRSGDRLLYGAGYQRREVARFAPALAVPLKKWIAALAPLPAPEVGRERAALGERKLAAELAGKATPFRLTAVPTLLGEHLHLHIFSEEVDAFTALGYTDPQADVLKGRLDGRPGLLLLAGAADAHAEHHRMTLAHQLSATGRLVVSLEHRIHQRSELLVQLDLGQKEGPGFAALWRTALGMAPDALFIDDIRDQEEAQALLEGIQSGAVVVAQARSSGARHALTYLKAMQIDAVSLAESLLAIVERRIVRRLCPACRTESTLTEEEARYLAADAGTPTRRPLGCERCGDGYDGRMALFGLYPASADLTAWILSSADVPPPFPTAPAGLGLGAAARQAVLAGDLTAEEALPFLLPSAPSAAV